MKSPAPESASIAAGAICALGSAESLAKAVSDAGFPATLRRP